MNILLKRKISFLIVAGFFVLIFNSFGQSSDLLSGLQVKSLISKAETLDEESHPDKLIKFSSPGKYEITFNAEFTVDNLPDAKALIFTKPLAVNDWYLNGKKISLPVEGMNYQKISGIPVGILIKGVNTISANAWVSVNKWGEKISPDLLDFSKISLLPMQDCDFRISAGPILCAAGTDFFTVSCRTSAPVVVTLELPDGKILNSKEGFVHFFKADGLKPSTEYSYKLTANFANPELKDSKGPYKITTFPDNPKEFVFACVGDTRTNPKIWKRISELLLKEKPLFFVHSGDIVLDGNNYDEWEEQFAAPAAELLASIPCFYAFGNHENNATILPLLFGMPQGDANWTLSIGDICFFGVDGSKGQKPFPADLLKKIDDFFVASNAKFKFLVCHYPPVSSNDRGNFDDMIKNVYPILKKNKCRGVISGHNHNYERSEPENGLFSVIVSGGGGATLYPKSQKHINHDSVKFFQEYNYLIFKMAPGKCEMDAFSIGSNAKLKESPELIDERNW